ncbi:hypothetical protein ISS40_00535 [Candidatus Bathyarchaeota archaeon]|nr:hypothetical protein [Candidatus Bathyarchaeota archaeon]
MASDGETIVNTLEKILELIGGSKEQMDALIVDAADMSEEWDLEIINDLVDVSQRVEELIEDITAIHEEAKANLERALEDEESLDEDDDID